MNINGRGSCPNTLDMVDEEYRGNHSMPRYLRVTLIVFAVFAVLVAVISTAFYVTVGMPSLGSATRILTGGNMLPTLHAGERIICDSVVWPSPGVIIAFDDPSGRHPTLVSRIIAVGGQTIDLEDGAVIIDGIAIDEPYLTDVRTYAGTDALPVQIPEGYVWVMGDNRSNSGDSRYFGPIPVSSIQYRVTFVYWPPDAFRRIERP